MTATLETPQHLEALDRANQLRFAQTDLLRDLSSNKVSLEVLLADERAASLKFERVLAAMAHRSDAVSAGVIRQSRGTARKIAKAAKVRPATTVNETGLPQRESPMLPARNRSASSSPRSCRMRFTTTRAASWYC